VARVILIDDEPRLLRTLARFLERDGHDVATGARFVDVESLLNPGEFDVLVTDILMPEVSGIDILRRLTQAGCQEPIILMTGEPNLDTAAEAVRLGAFDYIRKPVLQDRLLEVVHRASRNVQLVRERDAARQAEVALLKNLARIGESAAILTHEIKTPITNLNQALRAVADKLEVESSTILRELIERMEYIQLLMTQTLSFAKPLELELADHRVSQILNEVERHFEAAERYESFSIEMEGDKDARVRADATALVEVLINLVQNAAEACDFRGRARLRASCTRDTVVITVEDDGPGIDSKARADLFKLFHSSKKGGTGMGLPISKKAIEAQDGSLELCDSELGGAGFRISLRRSAAHQE